MNKICYFLKKIKDLFTLSESNINGFIVYIIVLLLILLLKIIINSSHNKQIEKINITKEYIESKYKDHK